MWPNNKTPIAPHLLTILGPGAIIKPSIRGHKVMLDTDLADLVPQVPTKVFHQAVKRNKTRFPEDFMFQLSKAELENWRSQIVTSKPAAKMALRRPPAAVRLSPRKVWPCCRPCCTASAPSRRALPLCAYSLNCVNCWPLTWNRVDPVDKVGMAGKRHWVPRPLRLWTRSTPCSARLCRQVCVCQPTHAGGARQSRNPGIDDLLRFPVGDTDSWRS